MEIGIQYYLQLSGLLELLHVTLSLDRTAGSQEDILVVAVDILHPVGEPSSGFVVDNSLPLARNVRLRCRDAFANIDRDVLRLDAVLDIQLSNIQHGE